MKWYSLFTLILIIMIGVESGITLAFTTLLVMLVVGNIARKNEENQKVIEQYAKELKMTMQIMENMLEREDKRSEKAVVDTNSNGGLLYSEWSGRPHVYCRNTNEKNS